MNQEQINILYEMTIMIHEDVWFGKRKEKRDRDEVQEWVSKTLASNMDIYTIPCGMSWGILVSKERFDEYWKENSKIK